MRKFYLCLIVGLLHLNFEASAQSLRDSLLLYLPFNGNAHDSIMGNNGTVTNATLSNDYLDSTSRAYSFNSDGRIVVPHNSIYNTASDAFTFAGWIKVTALSSTERAIFCKLQGSDRELVIRHQSLGVLHTHFNSRGTLKFCSTDSAVIKAGTWQFVAVTWDGSNIRQYINGELKQSCSHSGANVSLDGGTFNVGTLTSGGSELFNGSIDEVRFYKRTLNEKQIRDLYLHDKQKANLILDYNLNNEAHDNALYQNDGLINNAIPFTDRFGNTGGAMYFDGVDDNIIIPHDNSYKVQYPVTISAWIYMEDNMEQARIFTNNDHISSYYGVYFGTFEGKATISFTDGNGSGPQFRRTGLGTKVISSKEWHHIVGVIEGYSSIKLYVDGISDPVNYSGSGQNTTAYTQTDDGKIGSWDKSTSTSEQFWNGALDDLKMWGRALGEDEVAALFNDEATVINSLEPFQHTHSSIKLIPNPSNGIFQLVSTRLIDKVVIIGVDGSTKQEATIGDFTTIVDLSEEMNSYYFIKVFFEDGTYEVPKALKM